MRETGYMHNTCACTGARRSSNGPPPPRRASPVRCDSTTATSSTGRDANSFTNVAWVYGLHDRPWAKRKIFGTVRYQSENSLRKFDAKAYLKTVEALCRAEAES